MKTDSISAKRLGRVYLSAEDCSVEDLAALTGRQVNLAHYPHAADAQKNVLIYDCGDIRASASDAHARRSILAEWADALADGPGVIVLKRAETDHAMIDRASDIFRAIITEQHRTNSGGGDHFAKPGANDRIWNSLEKHCLTDPENFAAYYGNEMLALISEAWLGPYYQMTAQLNVVNPAGAAQSAHRDYHLGFQSAKDIERYPRHVQLFSPMLTLQGAVAHVDAPMETGPTLLLPFSQQYDAGYMAMGRPEFQEFFAANHVQLPLEKGDMLFFSPALLHAAGTNRSKDVKRMVNLFQVSSAYGRAMESVDRTGMCKALFRALAAAKASGALSADKISNAIAACAEGYSFPTNLDRDPPLGGLAPKSQAALLHEALGAGWTWQKFAEALDAQAAKKLTQVKLTGAARCEKSPLTGC
jgi:ectoine hydroxylase-related dioxygenase (phytanoyl-CoA dioxygenase family)